MFQDIQFAVKIRTLIVFLMIHVGLVLGIFALAQSTYPHGLDMTSGLLLASLVCLYGGIVLGVLFVAIPLLPWLRRAQYMEHWSERVVRDLPILLENMPQIIESFRKLLDVWNESRAKSKGTPTERGSHGV